jgi:hypothetical protein
VKKCNKPKWLAGSGRSCCRQNSIRRQNNMQPDFFDALVRHTARVLEIAFFVGAAGSAIVIVFTAYDVLSDIFKPIPHERREIDAIQRAA